MVEETAEMHLFFLDLLIASSLAPSGVLSLSCLFKRYPFLFDSRPFERVSWVDVSLMSYLLGLRELLIVQFADLELFVVEASFLQVQWLSTLSAWRSAGILDSGLERRPSLELKRSICSQQPN